KEQTTAKHLDSRPSFGNLLGRRPLVRWPSATCDVLERQVGLPDPSRRPSRANAPDFRSAKRQYHQHEYRVRRRRRWLRGVLLGRPARLPSRPVGVEGRFSHREQRSRGKDIVSLASRDRAAVVGQRQIPSPYLLTIATRNRRYGASPIGFKNSAPSGGSVT